MSRLLHTSDWHLGRTLYRHSRDEDFDAVLAEIVAIARESRPDLIVHSGDLFDSSRPSWQELMRAMRALDQLATVAPTVVLAGNHDSPGYFKVLSYLSGPSRGRGLFFVDRLRPPHEGGVLTFDACGGEQRIRLAVMPFVHPNRFWERSSVFGTTYADYAAVMRGLQAQLVAGLHEGHDPDRDVLVFAAHVLIAGARPSSSERKADLEVHYAIPAEDLPAVAYAALGHIHAPQPVAGVPADAARYAGSPLQLDFGEAGEAKSVVIVDADPGRPVRVMPRPLSSGRPLATFTGTLDELRSMAGEYAGAFLKAVITGEEADAQLGRKVAEIVPDAILISAALAWEASPDTVLDTEPGDEPDLPDAFRAYLAEQGLPGSGAQDTVTTFVRLLGELDEEDPAPAPAEELLRAAVAKTWTEAS
ncbi:metallophosphoesterase family protein [Streptomyces roseoverticillatus]|uniref:metallophosphoesterase family protein n=1 Tax=Streptomyces roseoverticillatus TaxID=66429 RepID=UPI0006940A0D|nr:exonuclease SbcCD subunit D [Streptomyces roseoverticillatus]